MIVARQRQTDRQTDRHAHCNTTLPYRERIKDGFATALEQHQYDTSIDWLAQSRHTYVQEAYHRYMIRCLYKIIILCCEICSWFRVPKLSSLWLFAAITSAKFSSQGTVTQVFLQAGWLSYRQTNSVKALKAVMQVCIHRVKLPHRHYATIRSRFCGYNMA